ncbi:MAG: hypothetical protein U5R49_25920 [Deltaproteobacteria bacterium]|nr:hypothetical protein [Deltaproteobacteria bacterium]
MRSVRGDPQCVRFCDVNAVEYVDAGQESIDRRKVAAERLSAAQREAATMQAEL